ncbi:MAG: YidC/Oxa1 family membrane protein insertase, partial [Pseudobdellovibrionaceae bacterium]
ALMGLSMYVQQKITPTTMDPMQQKILQFLPIVFALMMVALPSGLTLYIFISTLFGIIQQQIFMRDKSAVAATKEAKA